MLPLDTGYRRLLNQRRAAKLACKISPNVTGEEMNTAAIEAAPEAKKLPIRGRLLLLSALSLVGALSFLPTLLANNDPPPGAITLTEFVLAVTVISSIAAWLGLRAADAAQLRMPLLRRLDGVSDPVPARGGLRSAIASGALIAAAAILILDAFQQPNMGGSLGSRLASTLFAAINLETVIHLFVMSGVVRLAGGRIWLGIVVSTLLFVIAHAAGSFSAATGLLAASVALNGSFGAAVGVLYARYGFEYAVLCHAIGHGLAVTVAFS